MPKDPHLATFWRASKLDGSSGSQHVLLTKHYPDSLTIIHSYTVVQVALGRRFPKMTSPWWTRLGTPLWLNTIFTLCTPWNLPRLNTLISSSRGLPYLGDYFQQVVSSATTNSNCLKFLDTPTIKWRITGNECNRIEWSSQQMLRTGGLAGKSHHPFCN